MMHFTQAVAILVCISIRGILTKEGQNCNVNSVGNPCPTTSSSTVPGDDTTDTSIDNDTSMSTQNTPNVDTPLTGGIESSATTDVSTTEDYDTLTSTQNTPNADASKADDVEFVFGVVLAVVITCTIVAFMLGFIFIKLRKKGRKASKNAYSYIETPAPASTNVRVVSNLTYNDSPLIETADKSNKIDNSPNYSFAEPIQTKNETGNYSFAKPILPESNNPNDVCYDHPSNLATNIGQPGIKSTTWLIKDNHTVGTYDHLSGFKREEESVNNTNSSYDHIQPNAESDTYYDVSGTGIHGDGVDYDHLPPNINTDPSTDYVSTQKISVHNNVDGYDHFELK